jgi:hypothetical protein
MNSVANNVQKLQNLNSYNFLTPGEILQVPMGGGGRWEEASVPAYELCSATRISQSFSSSSVGDREDGQRIRGGSKPRKFRWYRPETADGEGGRAITRTMVGTASEGNILQNKLKVRLRASGEPSRRKVRDPGRSRSDRFLAPCSWLRFRKTFSILLRKGHPIPDGNPIPSLRRDHWLP